MRRAQLQMRNEKGAMEESPKRLERAQRILDAAAELVQRWGYKKTTVDDIARQAGVAKGTIYLHWKTREALFEALLTREWLIIARDLQQLVASYSEEATLQSWTRRIMAIVLGRPLIKAVLTGDRDILGELLHSSNSAAIMQMRLNTGRTLLTQLRNSGMIRTDIDLERQLKMVLAIAIGFLTFDQYLPEPPQASAEEIADMIAETLHGTFAPQKPPAPASVRAFISTFLQQFEQLREHIQKTQPEIVV